jgi:hypothetical protein
MYVLKIDDHCFRVECKFSGKRIKIERKLLDFLKTKRVPKPILTINHGDH